MNRALRLRLVISSLGIASASAADPLPLSTSYWRDPAFVKAFNGSYRIEARIEPTVSTEERGLLVEIQSLMEKGDRKGALAKIKASPLANSSAAIRFNLGNLHFEEGQLGEAIAAYRAALKDYPSFRRAHRNLAVARIRNNEMEEALPHLLEAIRLGDSDGATYGLLGYCRLERGEWASALQAYRLAQLAESDTAEWKAGIAQCLQHLNARDEAAALLDEVIRIRPQESSYSVLQASILLDLNRNEDAVKALELPRRLGSLDGDGLLLLADLHLRAGRRDMASAVIGEAFAGEKKPGTDRVIAVAGGAMNLQDWDLAKRLIDGAKSQGAEESRPLRRTEARFLIDSTTDPARGADLLRTLLGEDPTDGPALIALGKHEAAIGKSGEAELIFERATAVEDVAPDAWVELTKLRIESKRYSAALDAVDHAIKLRPSAELEEYRKALARLVDAAG